MKNYVLFCCGYNSFFLCNSYSNNVVGRLEILQVSKSKTDIDFELVCRDSIYICILHSENQPLLDILLLRSLRGEYTIQREFLTIVFFFT